MRRTFAAAVLTAALAAPTSAQIAWDGPALIGPVSPAGVSLFILDAAGGELGGLATFRHDAGPVGVGYRLALAEQGGPDGDFAVSGGVDVSGFLSRGIEGSEIDVVWWAGGGIGLGDETLVTIPVGLVLGWSGSGGDVILSPYGGAHVNFEVSTLDTNNLDLVGVVDLGLDLVVPSGWMVRFGVTVGDRDSLALGVKLPS